MNSIFVHWNDKGSTLVPEVYFYYFHCEEERKINLWLKAAIDSSSHTNQFELAN
jgi:hypothetical protein